ncbi:MAG: lysylphosphatidylglycerol synthase transmembrane domain-containing protein, partial [Vicinamibacteria bacterium]
MRERLNNALAAVFGLAVFVVALEVLRRELHAVSWQAFASDVLGTPLRQLGSAIGLTILGYAALTGYDFIAFAYIGRRISRWRIGVTSLLAYAIANNVGFAMLSGASIRYRFYTRWGVTGQELTRIVFSNYVAFWLGLFALGGLSLALSPLPEAAGLPGSELKTPLGSLLVLVSVAYVVLAATR